MAPVSTAPPVEPRRRYWWVPYLYLLRVQVATAAILLLGPPLALLSPLFRGLFDLDYGAWWRTLFGLVLVTLAAFSTAWTLLATTWATASNAPERFDTDRIRCVTYPITWPERECFGIFALPTVVVAVSYTWWASHVSPWILLTGVILGLVTAVGALLLARESAARLHVAVHRGQPRGLVPRFLRWIVHQLDRPNVREGIIDRRTGELAQGQPLAWVAFTFSAVLYVAIGVGKWVRIGYETTVPTLACVLLLVLML